MHAQSFSRVQLFVTLWILACKTLQSMGFSTQEYWNGLLFPLPWDLPNRGIEPKFSALQGDPLPLSHLGSQVNVYVWLIHSAVQQTVTQHCKATTPIHN